MVRPGHWRLCWPPSLPLSEHSSFSPLSLHTAGDLSAAVCTSAALLVFKTQGQHSVTARPKSGTQCWGESTLTHCYSLEGVEAKASDQQGLWLSLSFFLSLLLFLSSSFSLSLYLSQHIDLCIACMFGSRNQGSSIASTVTPGGTCGLSGTSAPCPRHLHPTVTSRGGCLDGGVGTGGTPAELMSPPLLAASLAPGVLWKPKGMCGCRMREASHVNLMPTPFTKFITSTTAWTPTTPSKKSSHF